MNAVLSRMLATQEGIAVCWLGNLSWLLYAEGRLIAFDLDLHSDLRFQPSPIPAEEIAPVLDVHFITHKHGDHFNATTSGILAAQSECLFVVPANCVEKARSIGLTDDRIRMARPREPFDLPGLHVSPARALHGHADFSVYKHANLDDCGYCFTFGGKTFLQPGDSVLLHDHLELTGVDVLFVSPTMHNMYTDRSAVLINALEPAYIFPQHFDTYTELDNNRFWTKGYPDELKAAIKISASTLSQTEVGRGFRYHLRVFFCGVLPGILEGADQRRQHEEADTLS